MILILSIPRDEKPTIYSDLSLHYADSCFKKKKHAFHYLTSLSESDICKHAALLLQALLLSLILGLIIFPLITKLNLIPLPTCMAELITCRH